MTVYLQAGWNKAERFISTTVTTIERAFNERPAFYAKENFVRNQRVAAVALIAIASVAAVCVGPAAVPLFKIGCIIGGVSLIQQVLGDARGCHNEKVARAIAGFLLMTGSPLSCMFGAFLWNYSNKANGA